MVGALAEWYLQLLIRDASVTEVAFLHHLGCQQLVCCLVYLLKLIFVWSSLSHLKLLFPDAHHVWFFE